VPRELHVLEVGPVVEDPDDPRVDAGEMVPLEGEPDLHPRVRGRAIVDPRLLGGHRAPAVPPRGRVDRGVVAVVVERVPSRGEVAVRVESIAVLQRRHSDLPSTYDRATE